MTDLFQNRVALITGASRGIGLAAARRLALDGAALVLCAHPADESDLSAVGDALRGEGANVTTAALDLCAKRSAAELVAVATKAYGQLDVAIANAGVSAFHDWFEAPKGSFDSMIASNLTATHDLLKAVAASMAQRGSGAIGVTASISGWFGDEMMVEYNASKAGVIGLTRSLSVTLARHNIRVNAVAPGWVATEMTKAKLAGPYWEMVRERIPMHRAARPEEIADVFAWLCSDQASYVTGNVITVDGGLSAGLIYPRVEMPGVS